MENKKPFELRKELAEKVDKLEQLAAKDQRTDDEATEMKTLRTDVRSLLEQVEDAELLEAGKKRVASQHLSEKEKKTVSTYSFARAINQYLQNGRNATKIDGLEGEMHQEYLKEIKTLGVSRQNSDGFGVPLMVLENTRASTGQNVTTAGDGGNLLQDEPAVFIESLKNALVVTGLGARFLTGLRGNLPLLKGGSFTASWIAEGSNVSFTKEAFSKATMSPKNLMVAGALSKQLLVQTENVAESLIRTELLNAMAQGLQNAAINGSGIAPVPRGILNTSGIGSVVCGDPDGAALDWDDIVKLETEIAQDNVLGEIKYLTNSKVRGKLKTTLKASGVAGYIWQGGEINGGMAAVTNAVPSDLTKGGGTGLSAIIAGVWEELFMGMWGGMDIVVDPYTRADYNELKLVINQFADVALRNAEAFSAAKDVVTV